MKPEARVTVLSLPAERCRPESRRKSVELRFIQPGKPVQNAHIERSNSRFRDECLSQHWFVSLGRMRSVVDNWRDDYNYHRPHRTLGYVPPALFAAQCRQRAGGTAQTTASATMQFLDP